MHGALYKVRVPNVNDRDGGHPPFRVVRIRLSVMPCGVVTVVDALHIVADAEDFPMVAINREGKGRRNGIPHYKKRDAGREPGGPHAVRCWVGRAHKRGL